MLCANPSGWPGRKECVDLAVLRRHNDNGAKGDRVITARTPIIISMLMDFYIWL